MTLALPLETGDDGRLKFEPQYFAGTEDGAIADTQDVVMTTGKAGILQIILTIRCQPT